MFLKVDVGQRRLGVEPPELARFAGGRRAAEAAARGDLHAHDGPAATPCPRATSRGSSSSSASACRGGRGRHRRARPHGGEQLGAPALRRHDLQRRRSGPPLLRHPPGKRRDGRRSAARVRSLRSPLIQVKALDHDERRPPPVAAVEDGMRLGIVPLGIADGLGSARRASCSSAAAACRSSSRSRSSTAVST